MHGRARAGHLLTPLHTSTQRSTVSCALTGTHEAMHSCLAFLPGVDGSALPYPTLPHLAWRMQGANLGAALSAFGINYAPCYISSTPIGAFLGATGACAPATALPPHTSVQTCCLCRPFPWQSTIHGQALFRPKLTKVCAKGEQCKSATLVCLRPLEVAVYSAHVLLFGAGGP